MWLCLNCGNENQNVYESCSHCSDGRWRCANCNKENNDIYHLCLNCATRKDGTPPDDEDRQTAAYDAGVEIKKAKIQADRESYQQIVGELNKLKNYYDDKFIIAERNYSNDQLFKREKYKKRVFEYSDPKILDELNRILKINGSKVVLVDEDEDSKYEINYLAYEGSSCFIATAAYGSPLASEVVLLSHFRDSILLESKIGAAFVKFYYRFSPPAAAFIAKADFLRALTRRLFLAPILQLLKILKFH